MAFCLWGSQTDEAYSNVGRTIVMQVAALTFGVHTLQFLRRNLTVRFPCAATVPSQEPHCPVSLCCYILNMARPGQFTAGGDAPVLTGTCCFQCLPVEEVAGCQDYSLLVGHDADNVAFAWVQFHLPGVLPFLQRVKVFLKQGLVLLVFNSSVQKLSLIHI